MRAIGWWCDEPAPRAPVRHAARFGDHAGVPGHHRAHLRATGGVGRGQRDLERHLARSLQERRRLLGLHPRALRPVHVRPVSRAAALAGRPRGRADGADGGAALVARPAAAALVCAGERHGPAAARPVAVAWRPWHPGRRVPRVGRADADHGAHGLCRPDRRAARHPAGDGTPLAPAADPLRVGRVHRVLARRADHHRDLPGLAAAAADHAGGLRRRQAGARDRGPGLRRRGLHGRGGARRPAGTAGGTGGGGAGAGPRLLADPAHDRAAAGAPDRAAGNDQRVHLAVQEHDARPDRLAVRPSGHRPGRAGRPQLGRHEHGSLCLRGRHLLVRLFRHVAMEPPAREAAAGRARAIGGSMAGKTLIKGAQVVTMDERLGDFASADILVENGAIAAIGPSLSAADAETIDAANMIALPGIIDAHTCLWQTVLRGSVPDLWAGTYGSKLLPWRRVYTAEDNYNAAYVGAHEALSYGTTTIVDYCHNIHGPGYADASIKALKESGIRHLFEHSFMSPPGDTFRTLDERLAEEKRVYETFHDPESLTSVGFGTDSIGSPDIARQLAFARGYKAPSCIHVNETGTVERLNAEGLLGPDFSVVHGNLLSNAELDMMAG